MSDDTFRSFCLSEARASCDILVLAETTEQDQERWAQDWRGRAAVYWASALDDRAASGSVSRDMAIFRLSCSDVSSCHRVQEALP